MSLGKMLKSLRKSSIEKELTPVEAEQRKTNLEHQNKRVCQLKEIKQLKKELHQLYFKVPIDMKGVEDYRRNVGEKLDEVVKLIEDDIQALETAEQNLSRTFLTVDGLIDKAQMRTNEQTYAIREVIRDVLELRRTLHSDKINAINNALCEELGYNRPISTKSSQPPSCSGLEELLKYDEELIVAEQGTASSLRKLIRSKSTYTQREVIRHEQNLLENWYAEIKEIQLLLKRLKKTNDFKETRIKLPGDIYRSLMHKFWTGDLADRLYKSYLHNRQKRKICLEKVHTAFNDDIDSLFKEEPSEKQLLDHLRNCTKGYASLSVASLTPWLLDLADLIPDLSRELKLLTFGAYVGSAIAATKSAVDYNKLDKALSPIEEWTRKAELDRIAGDIKCDKGFLEDAIKKYASSVKYSVGFRQKRKSRSKLNAAKEQLSNYISLCNAAIKELNVQPSSWTECELDPIRKKAAKAIKLYPQHYVGYQLMAEALKRSGEFSTALLTLRARPSKACFFDSLSEDIKLRYISVNEKQINTLMKYAGNCILSDLAETISSWSNCRIEKDESDEDHLTFAWAGFRKTKSFRLSLKKERKIDSLKRIFDTKIMPDGTKFRKAKPSHTVYLSLEEKMPDEDDEDEKYADDYQLVADIEVSKFIKNLYTKNVSALETLVNEAKRHLGWFVPRAAKKRDNAYLKLLLESDESSLRTRFDYDGDGSEAYGDGEEDDDDSSEAVVSKESVAADKSSLEKYLPDYVRVCAPKSVPDDVELKEPEICEYGKESLDDYMPGDPDITNAKTRARQIMYDFNCRPWGKWFLDDLKKECGQFGKDLDAELAKVKIQEVAEKKAREFVAREKYNDFLLNVCASMFVEYGSTAIMQLQDIRDLKNLQPGKYLSADKIKEFLHNPSIQVIDLDKEVLYRPPP